MRPLPLDPSILAPRNVRDGKGLSVLARTTIPELCAAAKIPLRVTSTRWNQVVLHTGTQHLRAPLSSTSFVGVGEGKASPHVRALRVLEVLAYGFHDYAARECVCGQGFFVAPKRRGRPAIGRRAMEPKERMRKMRASRRAELTAVGS